MENRRKSTRVVSAPRKLYQNELNRAFINKTRKKVKRRKNKNKDTSIEIKRTKKNRLSIRKKAYKSRESDYKFMFKSVPELMRVTRTIGHPPHDYHLPLLEDSIDYDDLEKDKLLDQIIYKVDHFFSNQEISGVSEEEFTNIVNFKEGREFNESIRQSKLGCVIMEFDKLIKNQEYFIELNLGEALQELKNEDTEPLYDTCYHTDNGMGKKLYFTLLNMAEEGGTQLFKPRIPMIEKFRDDPRTKHYYGTILIHNGDVDYQENHKLIGVYYSSDGLFVLARYSIGGRRIDSWINLLDKDVYIIDDRKSNKEFVKIIIREPTGYYKMAYLNYYGELVGGQFPKYLKLKPLTNTVNHKSILFE